MSVISIRIPEDIKKKAKRYDINLSLELRNYLERRVEELERREALEQVMAMLEKIPEGGNGFAEESIVEDRTTGWSPTPQPSPPSSSENQRPKGLRISWQKRP